MTAWTGTVDLVRLAVRRDRILLPAWIAVFALTALFSVTATVDLYPDVSSRVMAADAVNASAALVAMYGPIHDPTSIGALSIVKMTALGAALIALFTAFVAIRHTRGEEESGRLELVGAAPIGRNAALGSALCLTVGASLLLGLLTAAGSRVAGLPATGSLAFGASWAAVGVVFAAVGALAAQLTTGARTARALAVAAIAVAYLIRALGDGTGAGWLTWLSPLGIAHEIRPFAGDRWWALLPLAAAAALIAAAAFALSHRRDLGAGLIADRPGDGRWDAFRRPIDLAWRMQRGMFLGWAFGFAVLGGLLGMLAGNAADFASTDAMREMFARLGGPGALSDAFLATEMGFAALAAAGFAISSAARPADEESDLRAELLLSTDTDRLRWAGGHFVIALVGGTALLGVGGLAAGVAHAAQAGDSTQIGRVLVAALAQAPAVWVLAGVTVAAYGISRQGVAVAWSLLVAFLLLGEFGALFDLPRAVRDLSPFTHMPKLPGGEIVATPLLVCTGVAAVLVVAGLAALHRRDIV